MQMIYNFLKASMSDGNGTVAEHFGVDMAKYLPPKVTAPADEAVFTVYNPAAPETVIPAGTTVNVSVDDRGLITVTQADAEVDGTKGNLIDDIAVNTYAVQVDNPITVETLYHIITEITKHNTSGGPTTIFHIDDASTWGNVDGYTVIVEETENGSVFSGSTVTYVPTDGGNYHVHTQESNEYTRNFLEDAWEFWYELEFEDGLYGLPEYANDLTSTAENEEEETPLLDYDSENNSLFLNPGEYELPAGDATDEEPESGGALPPLPGRFHGHAYLR